MRDIKKLTAGQYLAGDVGGAQAGATPALGTGQTREARLSEALKAAAPGGGTLVGAELAHQGIVTVQLKG